MENNRQFKLLSWALIAFSFAIVLSALIFAIAWVAAKQEEATGVSEISRFEIISDKLVGPNAYFLDKKEGRIWKLYQDPETEDFWWGEMEFGKSATGKK